MQESVVYQELREEARQEVHAEVSQKARLEDERSLVLRLLINRVEALLDTARSQVEALSLAQLESLGATLLDVSGLADLEKWLAEYPEAECGN